MGKDNKLLWIIAAVGAGWLLAPKDLKEQITDAVPSIGIDLSGLLGGGVGQAPLGFGGLLPEFSWPAFEWPAFPESPLLDSTGIVQDILDAGNTAAGVIGKAASDAANLATGGDEKGSDDIAPTPPPAPKGTWEWMMEEFTGLHPVVKNVVAGAVGVGGVYGAVKGVQVLAPAARITTDAMARTFAAVLRGKKPPVGVTTAKPTPLPKWVNTKLGRQWLRFTSLGKGLGRIGGLGLAPLGIFDIIQEFDWSKGPLGRGWTEEAADVTIPWTSKTWNLKPQPEGIYPKQPVPMRAEREYTPKEPKLTLTQKYGTPEIKQPLYKPPLEGVQW